MESETKWDFLIKPTVDSNNKNNNILSNQTQKSKIGAITDPLDIIRPSSPTPTEDPSNDTPLNPPKFFIKAPMIQPTIIENQNPNKIEGITNMTLKMTDSIKSRLKQSSNHAHDPTPVQPITKSDNETGNRNESRELASKFVTGNAQASLYDSFKQTVKDVKMTDSTSDKGVVLGITEEGNLSNLNLENINYNIVDWINYFVDASNIGLDRNGKPIYIIIPDFADKELKSELEANSKGFTDFSAADGTCGKKYDVNARMNKMSNLTPEEQEQVSQIRETKKDMNTDDTADQVLQEAENIKESLESNAIFKFIKGNLKFVEYPFIYYKWIVKKIGIGFCRAATNIQVLPESTEDEKRLIITKMNAVFSLLISILVTYNWFFMMFYEYDGEKPKLPNIHKGMLKKWSPLSNFLLEFVLYPLDCTNWLLLKIIPNTMKQFITNDTILFFVLYLMVYSSIRDYGSSIVDLFYDSFKLLLNHSLKPWNDIMHHIYSDGSRYSITLKTYWFFHILIFFGQIPSFIPSFFSKDDADTDEDAIETESTSIPTKQTGIQGNIKSTIGTAVKTALPGGIMLGALSGFMSIFIKFMRFLISHYFVTLSAMFVAFYLIFYSFFGIASFSKLSFFTTIREINKFIKIKSSIEPTMNRCGIKGDCRGTFWERLTIAIYNFVYNTIVFLANSVYVFMILTILFFASHSYYKYIKSSTRFRDFMIVITILIAVIILSVHIMKNFFAKKNIP